MSRRIKYTKEMLEEAVQASSSMSGVLRLLGARLDGGTHTHISRRIRHLDIDTSHFSRENHQKGKPAPNRLKWTEILTHKPSGSNRVKPRLLRRALIEAGRNHLCEICGMGPIWNGEKLIFHVDHIDGNPNDSQPENVRFLCPNCHSQTPTWAARNMANRNAQQSRQ